MKNYSYSFVIANFALVFFLLMPMYNSPFGKLGGEIIIFMFITPMVISTFQFKDIKILSPFLFGVISILLTWHSTSQKFPNVMLIDGLIPTLSYSRNLVFGIIGLYLGKNMHAQEVKQFVKNFFYCALLITFFAIGQANFQFVREFTIHYYSSIPGEAWLLEDSIFILLKERPMSTLDRTWAYSYFAAVIFLSSISLPGFFRTKMMQYSSTVIFLIGLIYSGTRSAVLSVIAGLCLLIFTNTAVIEKRRNLIVKISGVIILFVIPSITYTYGFNRLNWFYNPFILGISGSAEEIQTSNSYLSRILYIERQLQIFSNNPVFGRLASIGWKHTDNLYISRLAYGGVIGLACTLMVPSAFLLINRKVKKYSTHIKNLSSHLILGNLLFWSAFCGLVMGIAWDFFVANRAMYFFIFIYSLLSGQLINIRSKSTENISTTKANLSYV